MRVRDWSICFVLAALLLPAASRSHTAQDAPYQAERQKAVEFFSQGKRLEALPLLEELVKAAPADAELLADLGASLVDHAATLTDQNAAGMERLRARGILLKARALGNVTPLTLNLIEILKQIPQSGDIQFSSNPQVEQAMRAGEAAFARRDFDDALRNYAAALELEPDNYTAVLFTANAHDRKGDLATAAQEYQRAIQIDPNIETAYRYYADMQARQGQMAEARQMLIDAAVAEPYNRTVWRELNAWATLNHTAINFVYVGIPPPPNDSQPSGSLTKTSRPTDLSAVWDAYRAVKEKWQSGGEFERRFPEEEEYRHSLPEETEALEAEAGVLEELKADKSSSQLVERDSGLVLLLKLSQTGMIGPYVLFSLGDKGIACDYAAYRAAHRDLLEEYVDKFVVQPAH
ncbi:MAG: tetratricopeptide repeat protein [Terracidiphilus sp.]|jgi:tetratricopeptide (TPR) repeat protein